MLNKILSIVKAEGPVLPIEVASKLKSDSFIVSAYLSQLAESGQIKVSKERVGTARLYYVAGQENKVNEKVNLLTNVKKTARTFAESVPTNPEIEKKRYAFNQRLAEIEQREKMLDEKKKTDFLQQVKTAITETIKKKDEKPIVAKPIVVQKQIVQPVQQVLKVEQKPLVAKPVSVKPEPVSRIIDSALAYLVDKQADILSKEVGKNGKDAVIVAVIASAVGPMKLLVKVKSKKTITESDLAQAHNSGIHRKLPVLLVTDGNLSKNAEKYLTSISGLVKVRKL